MSKIKKNALVCLMGDDRRYIVKAKGEFSTNNGQIDLGALAGKEFGIKAKTHLGKEFTVIEPRLVDLRPKRLPQIVMPKDIGLITGHTGLGKKDIVAEAGTGSGVMTLALANIAKKVYTYEIREDFFEVAKENLKGAKNVEMKNKDVCDGIEEKDIDVAVLDMGAPENAIETAYDALKPGGFLVVYSPVIEQVERVYSKLGKFTSIRTIEGIQRDWDIGNNKTRPRTRMLGHTAFLTFARRI